ncbi:hypothetical protein I302_105216 [Kwoniella bestiolae CBS 10118]|uniref:Cytoplasmic protein n=1 Tax=Kwoniella bestiolae CBS 10118 TaxID=1296100 RepID=A0A1B9FSH5_9TREE|nr:hypothetical protein I302_08503 [Kwoniella bestiolae CBS 10118]OCF21726.1 hypothetical protein I302_08503 [Kwoniella bestiolae CBS 10118]
MSNEQKTILITGANRGVGLKLTESFVEKGYKVIAAVRDLSKAPAIDGLAAVVKIDSNEFDDPVKAVEELKKRGIDQLDIVVANAGISTNHKLLREADMDVFDDHYRVNAKAPLLLYKAVYPLLVKKEGSKFIVISTGLSQNSFQHMPKFGVYGSSKAAVNYLTRQIHFEEPQLTTFMISPGWLDTEMGFEGAAAAGIQGPPEKISVAIPQIVDLIEKSDRESRGGYMWNYDGNKWEF